MDQEKDLVWLPKKLAEEIKEIQDDKKKEELILKYIDESKREIQSNLESLDDDVIRYKGLMLKAKKAFEDAKNEQLSASYELWENFEKELPNVQEKINKITNQVRPIASQIEELNKSLEKIHTYQIKDLLELLEKIDSMVQNDRVAKLIEIVIKHKDV